MTTSGRFDNVVCGDVQDPGPAELAMLIDEFGLHPLASEDAAHGQRRPKEEEFKGYMLLRDPGRGLRARGSGSCRPPRCGSVHRPELWW